MISSKLLYKRFASLGGRVVCSVSLTLFINMLRRVLGVLGHGCSAAIRTEAGEICC